MGTEKGGWHGREGSARKWRMMEDLVARRTAADLGGRAGLASDANHVAAELGYGGGRGGGSEVGRRRWRRIWAGMQGFGGSETAMEAAAMTGD